MGFSLPISSICPPPSAESGQLVSSWTPQLAAWKDQQLTRVIRSTVWSYGSDWPNGGEVDIIEGANTAHNNLISAHTSEGCVQDESLSGLFAGYQRNTDCYVGDHNVGCGFDPPSQAYGTYGDSFNAQSGGVYAMKWDEEHIKIWHFARGQIPTDIESRAPQPEGWGIPHAVFGGRECDVGQHFNNMRLVINIVSPISSQRIYGD